MKFRTLCLEKEGWNKQIVGSGISIRYGKRFQNWLESVKNFEQWNENGNEKNSSYLVA